MVNIKPLIPVVDFSQKDNEKPAIKINYSYPNSEDYYFISFMERIDFDKEKEEDNSHDIVV